MLKPSDVLQFQKRLDKKAPQKPEPKKPPKPPKGSPPPKAA
jgi:hypothetical protein